MKSALFFSSLITFSLAQTNSTAQTNNTAVPNSCTPSSDIQLDATFYSEPEFKGEYFQSKVNGTSGCIESLPTFPIKSYLSSASTKVVLFQGKNCTDPILESVQGGSKDVKPESGRPGSVFIEYNRHGSC